MSQILVQLDIFPDSPEMKDKRSYFSISTYNYDIKEMHVHKVN